MKKFLILFFVFVFSLVVIQCDKKAEDSNIPVITLNGPNPQYVAKDSVYNEPGYSAIDEEDGDISEMVKVEGEVNTAIEGEYILKYNVFDNAGNAAEEKQREVKVLIF